MVAHYTGDTVSEKFVPKLEPLGLVEKGPALKVLSLHSYHFDDPSFRWVPDDAQIMIFTWAQDVFMAHLAKSFVTLPDDCVGDVWECTLSKQQPCQAMRCKTL